ncbi:MAG: hypothetical protein K9N09_12220 [Candidatus Cloacimonetes bacterium]|nr:hypothetical protein [Candidatus Cloacimonadota bacterium]MCF7869449.1 hypothetical protein [Candidatus Cloacimonadota bacterium]
MTNYLIAMLLGLIFSITFHISRGMQQQGIKTLTFIKDKLKGHQPSFSWKECKPNIYIFGIILSNSGIIWVILAGKFAPASYFTSMYGLGLIVMLWYSNKILKERIDKWEYLGAAILIIGTVLIGIDGIFQPKLNYAEIDLQTIWWFVGIFTTLSLFALILIRNHRNLVLKSIIFGIFTGGTVSFDPIFKGIGQHLHHNSSYFPVSSMGWTVFLLSLVFTTAAFWITQWGFSKNVRAALLIPMHNSIFIVFPIFVQLLALPGYKITYLSLVGIVLILAGNLVMKTDEMKRLKRNKF